MIKKVRLSIGTAIQLGLEDGTSDPNFTTAFIMTYWKGKCAANCAFCPQARESRSASDRLSRISWPEYDFEDVFNQWSEKAGFTRVCIQTINYLGVVDEVASIAFRVRGVSKVPLSVAIHPIKKEELQKLKESGVTNIGIAIDACTAPLFDEIKGEKQNAAYRWREHILGLKHALDVFGEGNVTTHLIIGLGETEKEAADFLIQMYEMGVGVGLFAFTGIKGTQLSSRKSPDLSSYRRIQIVRLLISKGLLSPEHLKAGPDGRITLNMNKALIREILSSGEAFRVTGCRGCNRPYYNERPRGPMYNYPRRLTENEVEMAIRDSGLI